MIQVSAGSLANKILDSHVRRFSMAVQRGVPIYCWCNALEVFLVTRPPFLLLDSLGQRCEDAPLAHRAYRPLEGFWAAVEQTGSATTALLDDSDVAVGCYDDAS